MSDFSELPEYTRDTYPSFGKKYNNEIGVISLTSWTARINTVAKTLFSLVQQCPNFHIVLVLAEEEFPKMTAELPENLMLFVENELIELMFVRKNYRSFKKVLFTMDKYRDVPVISADDDCIYTCNYAQELYNAWLKNSNAIISSGVETKYNFTWSCGASSLYPPNKLNIVALNNKDLVFNFASNDDAYIAAVSKKLNIKYISLHKNWFFFHDDVNAMSKSHIYNVKRDLTNFYNNIKVKYEYN